MLNYLRCSTEMREATDAHWSSHALYPATEGSTTMFLFRRYVEELYRSEKRIHLRNPLSWNTKRFILKVFLYGLVVRVSGYRYRGPGLIPGATRFSEK
jgi:hypothetical protein